MACLMQMIVHACDQGSVRYVFTYGTEVSMPACSGEYALATPAYITVCVAVASMFLVAGAAQTV